MINSARRNGLVLPPEEVEHGLDIWKRNGPKESRGRAARYAEMIRAPAYETVEPQTDANFLSACYVKNSTPPPAYDEKSNQQNGGGCFGGVFSLLKRLFSRQRRARTVGQVWRKEGLRPR